MRKKKVMILIIALIFALIIIALTIKQVKNTQIESNTDMENESVDEIKNTNEIKKTSEDTIMNTNIVQKESVTEDIQEKPELGKENAKQEILKEQKTATDTKNTQEKVTENTKQTETKKATQTTEKVNTIQKERQEQTVTVQENKTENKVQEKPKCTDTKHGVVAGNSDKWFNSYKEAVSYYDNLINSYSDQVHSEEITSEEYYKLCPYGYETWSCPYCEKWTLNYYMR